MLELLERLSETCGEWKEPEAFLWVSPCSFLNCLKAMHRLLGGGVLLH